MSYKLLDSHWSSRQRSFLVNVNAKSYWKFINLWANDGFSIWLGTSESPRSISCARQSSIEGIANRSAVTGFYGRCKRVTKPFLRDTGVSGADLSSVPRNVGQGQRFEPVPVGWLLVVHAFGRERSEPLFHFGLDSLHADTGRSTLEGVRSRRGDARSSREELLSDPYLPEYLIQTE